MSRSQKALIISPQSSLFLFQVFYISRGDVDEPVIMLSLYSFIFVIFALGLALGVIISVGFLLGVQIRGIIRNRTGIEDYIGNALKINKKFCTASMLLVVFIVLISIFKVLHTCVWKIFDNHHEFFIYVCSNYSRK